MGENGGGLSVYIDPSSGASRHHRSHVTGSRGSPQPRAYRVYCEGACGEESDENEDLFDAIDDLIHSAIWPRQVIGDVAPTSAVIGWNEERGQWRTSAIVAPGPRNNEADPRYFVLEVVHHDDGSVGYRVYFHADCKMRHEEVARGSTSTTVEAKAEAEAAGTGNAMTDERSVASFP